MSYPTTVEIQRPERIANWRPIGQLILVIPHYVILHTVLNLVASLTAVVAWVTVLATGKLPPGSRPSRRGYGSCSSCWQPS